MSHPTRHETLKGTPEEVEDRGNQDDDRAATAGHASPGDLEMEVDVGSSQDYGDPNDEVVRGR